MNELEKLRKEIDEIDEKIAILFNERMKIVQKIKDYKKENNLPIQDKNREESLIKQNLAYINKEYQDLYIKLEQEFFKLSKDFQAK